MVALIYILALLATVRHAKSDLPIHALIRDIAGKWRFHITRPVDGLDVTCGSHTPNTLEGDLILGDYLDYITTNYILDAVADYNLTLDLTPYFDSAYKKNRRQWRALAVKDNDGRVLGRWTAIYDQGFEVVLKDGTRYFFYMHFTKLQGDQYETDAHSTQIGWVYSTDIADDHTATRRCAYGHKIDGRTRETTAVVKLLSNDVRDKYRQIDRVIKNGDYEIASAAKQQVERKKKPYPCDCSKMAQVNFFDEVPKVFQWRTRATVHVDNQQKCGNCYAIASRFVLQIRFIIALERMTDITAEHKLALEELTQYSIDDDDATQCDLFNQGCRGGYPYLTGKRMREFGVLTQKHANQQCSILSRQRRYFAKDYGYVGGCYQCTACQGEELIMREVFANGPVVTAIDASVLTDEYNGDIITVNHKGSNAGVCDVKGHDILSGWEYTSHAVAIVGWDEIDIDGKKLKYWICRNSWGEKWGNYGYFKIERGKNAFGIESEAVFIDPDLTTFTQRVNTGFLQQVHYHN